MFNFDESRRKHFPDQSAGEIPFHLDTTINTHLFLCIFCFQWMLNLDSGHFIVQLLHCTCKDIFQIITLGCNNFLSLYHTLK